VLAEYGEKEAENFMPSEPRPSTDTEQTDSAEPAPAAAGQWEPSPAELAEIAARERAEAGGLFDSADQQTSQPAPTGRRPRGSLKVE